MRASTTTSRPSAQEFARQQFSRIRQTTMDICEGLTVEDQMVQSMPDASPTKWHLAHTTWFFETFVLKPNLTGYRLFHKDFTFLFNSYYKQLGSHPNRAFRGLFSRPSFEEVHAYREYVDRHLCQMMEDEISANLAELIVLGLNHEQQHQELIITDVKHGLWSNPLRPAWHSGLPSQDAAVPELRWHDFEEGLYTVGAPCKPSSGLCDGADDFYFDNETPRHQVFLNRSSLASRLVTNAEYLEFIRDGGYVRPELWLSEGWDTVNAQRWDAPLYWEERGGGWQTFTVSGIQPVAMNEPVCHVSYYEADAFARWAGARLPLESEWEVVAAQQQISGNLLECGRFHPRSAGNEFTDDGSDLHQLFGDVWEWTASPYTAYPGFTPAAGALGEYNGKFMCNQFVLRGGSCATPQSHIRATYRNFFPPHARWQFMGIRLAK